MNPITRRRLLASAGAGAAGIGLGGATGSLVGHETAEAQSDGTGSVPFYGEHPAASADYASHPAIGGPTFVAHGRPRFPL